MWICRGVKFPLLNNPQILDARYMLDFVGGIRQNFRSAVSISWLLGSCLLASMRSVTVWSVIGSWQNCRKCISALGTCVSVFFDSLPLLFPRSFR